MIRLVQRWVWASALASALAGCGGGDSAANAKTEALPADGGEVGKAWLTFYGAMQAGDVETSKRHLDDRRWSTGNKPAKWFQQFATDPADRPMGGRIKGDRATLFLDASGGGSPDYRHVNATRMGEHWVFDKPTTFGRSFSPDEARDCSGGSSIYPCGVETAPAGQVGGTVTNLETRGEEPATEVLLDGFAVRMVPSEGAAPTATRVVLSAHGINPTALAMTDDPKSDSWLGWPVVRLVIAPDGKSAELEYYGGSSPKKVTVTSGLTLDTDTPGRIKGRVQAEIPKAASVDVQFDLGTTSVCRADQYPC